VSTDDVHNQPEQEEPTDEQADAEFEARLRGDEVEPGDPESPDAKPEGEAEGGEEPEATAEKPEESPDEELKRLRSENEARQKEIDRLRKLGRDVEIEGLKRELEETKKHIKQGGTKSNPIDEWDYETTSNQLALWEDKVDEYRESGDDEKLAQAKAYVRVIRKALPEKMLKSGEVKDEAKTRESEIQTGVVTMTELALENFPDIEKQEGELYEKVNSEMLDPKFNTLNASLGTTMASHFALYRLILKNPEVLKQKVKPDKVLKDVNKTLTKASMSTGSKNSVKPTSKIANDEEGDKIFEELLRGQRDSI